MTHAELKKDLIYLAKASGLDAPDLDDHVVFCIARGLADFWNACSWSWRTRSEELAITAEQEDYELPGDFSGVRTVRQKDSEHGGPIEFYTKEEFDRDYPAPTSYDAGYPIICTAYKNTTDGKWYIKFIRTPESGTIIYLDMYTTQGSVEGVPAGYESGLLASVEKYLYKLGTAARSNAWMQYDIEVKRLERTDTAFRGHLTRLLQPPPQLANEGLTAWFGDY